MRILAGKSQTFRLPARGDKTTVRSVFGEFMNVSTASTIAELFHCVQEQNKFAHLILRKRTPRFCRRGVSPTLRKERRQNPRKVRAASPRKRVPIAMVAPIDYDSGIMTLALEEVTDCRKQLITHENTLRSMTACACASQDRG
jgi:hypothetical protein